MGSVVPHSWLEGQVLLPLAAPDDPAGELEAKETAWYHLHPGEPGYDLPLHTYLGFTEDQWRARCVTRGWRR